MGIRHYLAVAAAALSLAAGTRPAAAHPHVFADARLDVIVDANGAVTALHHRWIFDDLFSSTVMFEFDKNRNKKLDSGELATVAAVVHESLAEFGYFQVVTAGGKDVAMRAPARLNAGFKDGELVIEFELAAGTAAVTEGQGRYRRLRSDLLHGHRLRERQRHAGRPHAAGLHPPGDPPRPGPGDRAEPVDADGRVLQRSDRQQHVQDPGDQARTDLRRKIAPGPELASGRLAAILDNWAPRGSGIQSVHPHRRYLPAKIGLFVDFLGAMVQ